MTTTNNASNQQAELRKFVEAALSGRRMGGHDMYAILLSRFGPAVSDSQKVVRWYQVFTSCASLIREEYAELIELILHPNVRIVWEDNDPTVFEAYRDLLLGMIASNISFVDPVLRMLVPNLAPLESQGINADAMFVRVISLIHRIRDLVPTATSFLKPLLEANYPHPTRSLQDHKYYITNLIAIANLIPELRHSIVCLAFVKLMRIDVEIKLDEDEIVFEIELDDVKPTSQQEQMASKLDFGMLKMFEFISNMRQHCDMRESDGLFTSLIECFNRNGLTTHKSKYTQFLIFYLCSFDSEYADQFINFLMAKLFNHTVPTMTRQCCAAYVGSYVSRAKKMQHDTVQHVVSRMCEWIHAYIDQFEHTVMYPDAQKDAIFYSMCQIVFYILCFKHEILLGDPENKDLVQSLDLLRIVKSKFNPFKIILPSIVSEFATVSRNYNLFDCRPIIERNKRIVLPTRSSFGGVNHLESFFPFDPYLLHDSKQYIEPLYNDWKDIRCTKNDRKRDFDCFDEHGRASFSINSSDLSDDDEYDDDEYNDDDDNDDGRNGHGRSDSSDDDGNQRYRMSMSIPKSLDTSSQFAMSISM